MECKKLLNLFVTFFNLLFIYEYISKMGILKYILNFYLSVLCLIIYLLWTYILIYKYWIKTQNKLVCFISII